MERSDDGLSSPSTMNDDPELPAGLSKGDLKATLLPTYSFVEELGLRIPPDIPVKNFISGTKYKPRSDDVIVSTYPKCGTTWTQSILWMMTNNLQTCPDYDVMIFDRFIDYGAEQIEEIIVEEDEVRVLKTHYPQWCVPWNSQTKYIVVVRNPYDCVVSFYNHTIKFTDYDFKSGKFSDYFKLFINGEIDWGCYFEHLVSWYKVKDEPNVLFLKFEDMKTDLRTQIVKIGNFLGGKYKEMVKNEQVLDKIKDGVDIQKLQSLAVSTVDGKFFGSGAIGGWKKYFTDDMIETMNSKFDEYDQKFNIGELWRDYHHLLPDGAPGKTC